ncbi:MAG: HAMP domain-containing protein, partial [Cytophagaceae bacterium]
MTAEQARIVTCNSCFAGGRRGQPTFGVPCRGCSRRSPANWKVRATTYFAFMSLKSQIRLGVFIMLGLLLSLGGYVIFTVHELENEAPAVQQANARLAQHAVYLFLGISTLLGVILMVRLPRLVTRPLHRLTADVERVAGPGPATRVAVAKNNEVGTVAAAVNRVLRQAEDERRATLAELITQRNRTESLVRSLDEGLLLMDQQGIIVLA